LAGEARGGGELGGLSEQEARRRLAERGELAAQRTMLA